ncbi:MAG: deoxyribonuclease IV [Pirellulales bacterium]
MLQRSKGKAVPYCFGVHMSVAGGLHTGIERAVAAQCDCVQIFTKNNNQWQCPPLTDEAVKLFRDAYQASGLKCAIAHTSYLINVASPDPAMWQKSIDALIVEWQRAERLGLSGLVMHPGAHLTRTPEEGLAAIVTASRRAADEVKPKTCRLLFENTAGQGSCLGWKFSQLGYLLRELDSPQQFGICFDTCHALAAGYDLTTADGLKSMIAEFESEIGFANLHAIHINDSKKGCGSRVDRHEHIGLGAIGEEAFKRFLKAKQFKNVPMFLETAKEQDEAGVEWDLKNLATLRRLAGTSSEPALSPQTN